MNQEKPKVYTAEF